MRRTTCYLLILSQVCLCPFAVRADQGPGSADLPGRTVEQLELARFLKAQNITTFPQYVAWFEQHMTYRPDGQRDYWSRPLDTLLRQAGDCEDLAFLNKEMLALFGIDGRVLGTRKDANHHVFLVFEHDHRIYVFDNTRCIRTRARSVQDIAGFLYRKYNIEYLLEVEQSPRHIRVLYDKSTLKGYAKIPLPSPSG